MTRLPVRALLAPMLAACSGGSGSGTVRLLLELMTAIRDRTAATTARGETIEQARKSVRLDDLRRRMAGDSPVPGLLFDSYVAGPAIGAASSEA